MREDGELALEVSPPGERGDRGQPATSAPHTVFVSQAGNLWLLLREDDHEEPTMLNLETGEVRAFSRVAYLLTWGWREL
jgi:hypothetical protein